MEVSINLSENQSTVIALYLQSALQLNVVSISDIEKEIADIINNRIKDMQDFVKPHCKHSVNL